MSDVASHFSVHVEQVDGFELRVRFDSADVDVEITRSETRRLRIAR